MSDAPDTLWQCQDERCGAILRAADLRRVIAPGVTTDVCPRCGGPVARTGPPTASDDVQPGKPVPSFASALVYPFRGKGLLPLGLGTLLVGLLSFGLPFLYGYVVTIAVYGYMCNYLFDVVLTTANGEDAPPGLADSVDWWEEILQPILLMISATALCFSPSILYFFFYLWHCWYEGWAPDFTEPMCTYGVVGFGLVSLLYYPMGLLSVVMHNARRALDPRLVVPSIVRVWRPYLAVCGFMMLMVLVQLAFAAVFTGDSLLAHFTVVFLKLWSAMASMRLLGLLYQAHEATLNWFP